MCKCKKDLESWNQLVLGWLRYYEVVKLTRPQTGITGPMVRALALDHDAIQAAFPASPHAVAYGD